jgi:hypothetical protein
LGRDSLATIGSQIRTANLHVKCDTLTHVSVRLNYNVAIDEFGFIANTWLIEWKRRLNHYAKERTALLIMVDCVRRLRQAIASGRADGVWPARDTQAVATVTSS